MPEQESMDIESVYERIKIKYFPEWDCNHEWRVQIVDKLKRGVLGFCCYKSKTISLLKDCSRCQEQNYLLLIHEISHAVTSDSHRVRRGHDESWKEQMRNAAKRAKEQGENELAQHLNDEANSYIGLHNRIDKQDVRDQIRDCVMKLGNSIIESDQGFKTVIETVGRERRLSVQYLLKFCPEAQDEYLRLITKMRRQPKNKKKLR